MMDKKYLEAEFDRFFEFDSEDRSAVTSVSAKLFVEHMAKPLEVQVEQLRSELDALRAAVRPFVALVNGTDGAIPTERLSFADWHALATVGTCGKRNDGVQCAMPAGSKCPDCGVALHDFGAPD